MLGVPRPPVKGEPEQLGLYRMETARAKGQVAWLVACASQLAATSTRCTPPKIERNDFSRQDRIHLSTGQDKISPHNFL